MGLTDERLALARLQKSVETHDWCELKPEEAAEVLAEVGRLRGEQERLREALRRCEYADLTGSTPTCPACGYATPVYHEGELLGGGHAKGCWMREALVGEQDTTTSQEPG